MSERAGKTDSVEPCAGVAERNRRFRAGKAGAKALRDRLGSDEAVTEHYRQLQRKSAERRRKDAERRSVVGGSENA